MQTFISIIIFTLVSISSFAQAEKEVNKTVAAQVESLYNRGRYDSLFALFSPAMQKALPLDKTTDFFNGIKSQAGQIKTHQFINYQHGSYASYKTVFERALFSFNISVDDNGKINGLFVKPFTDETRPVPERNSTKLKLPFKDEWTVVWGGDTKEQNYHVENEAQRAAFDLVIKNAAGNSFKTTGKLNTDYYAFGKEILAPCNGKIVLVVDGVKDNVPGQLNPVYVPGNTVILQAADNEYLFFAHFKQRSIRVKEGQQVMQGQVLGLCGNSGNSSEPHLHFHIQNTEDMNVATGIKCYFSTISANGQKKSDYSPVQNEKIKNN